MRLGCSKGPMSGEVCRTLRWRNADSNRWSHLGRQCCLAPHSALSVCLRCELAWVTHESDLRFETPSSASNAISVVNYQSGAEQLGLPAESGGKEVDSNSRSLKLGSIKRRRG